MVFSAYAQRGYECGCCEMLVIRICSSSYKCCVFGAYRNLDLFCNIFHCLLTAMAKVQSVNGNLYFLFVGHVNAHHEKWLGSSTTNSHGRAFASSLEV